MNEKRVWTWALRIILTLSCILVTGWIFSNSMQNGEASSAQSAGVTEIVKEAVETFAPDLVIAETEEETFSLLHGYVRTAGHFCEFALLSALLTFCVSSYTLKKPFFLLPLPFCALVAFTDEYIQTFSEGRAWELKDVGVDSLGAFAGFCFALCALTLLSFLLKRRKK